MLRMSVRGLVARKLRTFLTGFAVVIGVAFVSGTFILTDTINASFKDLFERISAGTDVSITANKPVDVAFGGRAQRLPDGTFERVRAVSGVGAAERFLSESVTIFDQDGKRIGGQQGASLLLSTSTRKRFDPQTYVDGGPATRPRTATLDQATAEREGLEVGDTLRLVARAPAEDFELVGITKIGGQKSLGIASVSVSLAEAQRITREPGGYTDVNLAAADGTSPAQLKANVIRVVGDAVTVRTGAEQAERSAQEVSDSLGFLKTALLVFAFVALLVGSFLIFNTFAVTVAQRSREFALLRTLGASRAQVLRSVVVETLIVGFVASLAGLLGGLALAPALRALMAGFGIELPTTGTVVGARTVIVALVVGMLATLVSGLVPARRATQVEPVEAMREATTPGVRRVGRKRLVLAGGIVVAGLAVMLAGLFGGASGNAAASLLGLGTVVMMLGVALLAPVLVRPLARALGAPLERLQGLPGRLARENAQRQPQRTAITASALMVGLALVVFTAIFAAGLSSSIDKVIDEQYGRSALIVTHDDGFSPVSAGVAEALKGVEGVRTVSPLRWDQANVRGGGDAVQASGVDPATITKVLAPVWDDGDSQTLAALRDDQMLADKRWAADHRFAVGDTVEVTTPPGRRVRYELAGTYETKAGSLGKFLVTNASMSRDWDQPDDALILVSGQGDPGALERRAERALDAFPVAKAQTLAEYKESSAKQIDQLLGLVYALLSLSVIVALLGIVNTLALAVHERTRELGLLRAVGMSRRQVRRMVRAEAVITALIGAALGLVLGAAFAVIVSRPLADEGFVLSFPIGTLVVLAVLAGLAGVLAAIPPARRAARVDVLRAVTTE